MTDQNVRLAQTVSYPNDSVYGERHIAHDRDTTYDTWRIRGPVVWADNLLGSGAWLVTSYDACRQVLSENSNFNDQIFSNEARQRIFPGEDCEKHLFFVDEQTKQRLLNLLEGEFEAAIESTVLRVNACCDQLIPYLRSRSTFDVVHNVAWPLACVAAEFIGIDMDDMWRFPALRYMAVGSRFLLPFPNHISIRHHILFEDQVAFVMRLISYRRRYPKDDLITKLIKKVDSGCRIAERELALNILFLADAWLCTLRDQFSGALLALVENRDETSCLVRNLEQLQNSVRELRRFSAPDQLRLRVATRNLQLDSVPIARGELVVAVIGAANRDAKVFFEPNQLRLTRSNAAEHLAAEAGSYLCLCERFLERVLATVIQRLISEIDKWCIAPHEQAQAQFILDFYSPDGIRSVSWDDQFQDRALRSVMVEIR